MRIRLLNLTTEALNPRGGDDDDDDQEVVKNKEAVEEDELGYEWPTPDESPKSMEDELTLAQLSNTTPTTPSRSPSAQGKRKKCKEMKDKVSQTKKKKPSASKSKHVIADLTGKCVSRKQEKTAINGQNSPGQVKSPTMIRAEDIQLSLGPESPSFIKFLVRSHVASCFWMGLPVPFCRLHLPRKDTIVILEDESEEQFELKYIAEKTGLSAGWRKFATGHKLLEGDVLVFHLVGPNKFKVHIIRANDLNEVDGALSLLNLDAHAKENEAEKENEDRISSAFKINKRKRPKSLPLSEVQKKNRKRSLSRVVPQLGPAEFSGPADPFKDVKSFEDFHILVNGLFIDTELTQQIRMKYYDLCCSRNAFLHDHLLPGLNCKLIAGIIGETVSIADAIRDCKFNTSRDEFELWKKSLESFGLLGMNVGFLWDRLHELVRLAFESEGASDAKRYMEARTERTHIEDEIRSLEAKLVELKAASEKFDADIETLKSKAKRYELKFQEEANAPW